MKKRLNRLGESGRTLHTFYQKVYYLTLYVQYLYGYEFPKLMKLGRSLSVAGKQAQMDVFLREVFFYPYHRWWYQFVRDDLSCLRARFRKRVEYKRRRSPAHGRVRRRGAPIRRCVAASPLLLPLPVPPRRRSGFRGSPVASRRVDDAPPRTIIMPPPSPTPLRR